MLGSEGRTSSVEWQLVIAVMGRGRGDQVLGVDDRVAVGDSGDRGQT